MMSDLMTKALSRIIAMTPCRVVHVSYPRGTTCTDCARDAKRNPSQYGAEFRARLIAGEELCSACRIRVTARKALLGSDTGLEMTDALLDVESPAATPPQET